MAKKSSPSKEQEEHPDLATRITEHPYFKKLVEHKTYIPYVSIGLLVILFFAFKFFTGKTAHTESNYLLANNYFSMIQQGIHDGKVSLRDQALTKLKAITDDYPELHSRYDGLIAQLLIAQNQTEEALPYAQRVFDRTERNHLPHFMDFAKTTLQATEGSYEEALAKALALKEQLLQATKSDSTLFAYNLLRIAMLEQVLAQQQEELATWEEWEQYLATDSEAFTKLDKQISEANFPLQQYIEVRKKELK